MEKVKDWRRDIIFQAAVEDKARVEGTIIKAITYINEVSNATSNAPGKAVKPDRASRRKRKCYRTR